MLELLTVGASVLRQGHRGRHVPAGGDFALVFDYGQRQGLGVVVVLFVVVVLNILHFRVLLIMNSYRFRLPRTVGIIFRR